MFVPWVIVTGLSVFARSVKHGMRKRSGLLLHATGIGEDCRCADLE